MALPVQNISDRKIDKENDLIGEILYEPGYMKRSKIKKVIKLLKKTSLP